jgi:hypothetical protein
MNEREREREIEFIIPKSFNRLIAQLEAMDQWLSSSNHVNHSQ